MNKELFLFLQGKVVKIDRGGPESRVGQILSVADDYITVLTEEDGVVFYNTHHIKSLTDNVKQGLDLEFNIPEDFEYIKAQDFRSVLASLRFRWVQVNRGGPEVLEGVLDEAAKDYITIISNEEVIRLSMFHIRSISYGVKVEKIERKEAEAKEKDGKKQDNKATEKDASKEKDSKKQDNKVTEKDVSKEKDGKKQDNKVTEKDVSKEKDGKKQDNKATEKDASKEKDGKKQDNKATEKDASKEKDVKKQHNKANEIDGKKQDNVVNKEEAKEEKTE